MSYGCGSRKSAAAADVAYTAVGYYYIYLSACELLPSLSSFVVGRDCSVLCVVVSANPDSFLAAVSMYR